MYGVGTESDTGAHFGELVGGLIEVEGYVVPEKANGEGEARYATATNSNGEWLLRLVGGGAHGGW